MLIQLKVCLCWLIKASHGCDCFAPLNSNRLGPTGHSRSWCPLGSRWPRCLHHQPLWRLTRWPAHNDWVTGGKQFVCSWRLQQNIGLMDCPCPFFMFYILQICHISGALKSLFFITYSGNVHPWGGLCCSGTARSLPWIIMIDESYVWRRLLVMVRKTFGSNGNLLFLYRRKVHPHGNHYSSMIAHSQPFLTNQMTMSTHQPINIGIAHVVWPQPAANKRAKPCVNR